MSDDQHALLGASSAHNWGYCAAALRAQKGLVDRGSRDADEGTAAHTLGAWALTEGKHPSEYPDKTIKAGEREFPVTAEMIKNVWTYVQAARKDAEGGTLLVERKVVYGPMIFGEKDMFFDSPDGLVRVNPKDVAWGTSDLIALLAVLIKIRDYKNGANPNNIVEAVDNDQLYLYLAGALYEFGMLGDYKRGAVAISQPRLDHAPEHEISIDELMAFCKRMGVAGRRALELYYREAEPELSDYTPGDSCKWCKRQATCPALMVEVETETRDFFGKMLILPDEPAIEPEGRELIPAEIPQDRLSKFMDKIHLVEDFCKAVRGEVERRLLAGHPVDGYKLVQGRRGPRSWVSDDNAEAALKSFRLKIDEIYDMSVISPTSAEKLLKEKNPKRWAKLQALVTQTDGKPSVAPMSDKRPAIQVSGVDFAALAISRNEPLADVEGLV